MKIQPICKIKSSQRNKAGSYRTYSRSIILGSMITLLSACDSTDTGGLPQSSATTGAQPEMSSRLDVPGFLARTAATSPTEDLLVNGNFEQGLHGWQACTSNPPLTETNTSSSGDTAVLVKNGNCAQQGVSVIPNNKLILSCDAKMKSNRNIWTGLGIAFYDEFWNFISEPDATVVNGTDYARYTVTATVPANAQNAGIWLYTENQAIFDNCTLLYDSVTPPVDSNLLVNGDFSSGVDTADNWRDGCNGFAQRVENLFGTSLYTGSGSCVHQRLSNNALQSLQGKDFAYRCDYTSSSDDYAIMATNLSTRRDETGVDDEALLPRTYFGGTPSFQVETVTIYAKAKDYLEPNGYYVMLGSQAAEGITVLGCSLEIAVDNY